MKKHDDQLSAYMGKNTDFEGKLSFRGTIRIDDHFKGEIKADGTLIIGESALIEGDLHVASVVISGEVHGKIVADNKIAVLKPGRVFGDMQAPAVVIDEGAIFEGDIRMHHPKKEITEEEAGSKPQKTETKHDLGTIYGVVRGTPTNQLQTPGDIFSATESSELGIPIKRARIIAICKGHSKRNTKTDESGYYRLTDMEDGSWKVKVKAKGYEDGEAIVEIIAGGEYEQDFT